PASVALSVAQSRHAFNFFCISNIYWMTFDLAFATEGGFHREFNRLIGPRTWRPKSNSNGLKSRVTTGISRYANKIHGKHSSQSLLNSDTMARIIFSSWRENVHKLHLSGDGNNLP